MLATRVQQITEPTEGRGEPQHPRADEVGENAAPAETATIASRTPTPMSASMCAATRLKKVIGGSTT